MVCFGQNLERVGWGSVQFIVMNSRLLNAALRSTAAQGRKSLAVAIVYEDHAALRRAEEVFGRLHEEFASEASFSFAWASFVDLNEAGTASRATRDALNADVIVIAAHAGNELPCAVEAWIETWVRPKGSQGSALVALIGLPEDRRRGITPVHVYLRDVAERAGMGFFSQVIKSPEEILPCTAEMIAERAHKRTPTQDGLPRKPISPPHWGINE